MRPVLALLLLISAAPALFVVGNAERGTPLWPGARHTAEERDRAVLRGLAFMYRASRTPASFQRWGHDLVGAFFEIASTSASVELRYRAWLMAHERALEWRRLHRDVPPETEPGDLANLVWGKDTATRLGVPDRRMTVALKAAVGQFTATDYLGFEPVREPPPSDLPESCERCAYRNVRGARRCARCGAQLTFSNRYALFQEALINTSIGDQARIPLGARYEDVLKWLAAMRPWPERKLDNRADHYAGIYCATHVIYTYNRYAGIACCAPVSQRNLRI